MNKLFTTSTVNLTDNVLTLSEMNLNDNSEIDKYSSEFAIMHDEFSKHLSSNGKYDPVDIVEEIKHLRQLNCKVLFIKSIDFYLGYICGYIVMCVSAYDSDMLTITSIYLKKNCRGIGYSTKIFKLLSTYAKSIKLKSLGLNVTLSNIPAVKSYLKNGFKPISQFMKKEL